MKRKLRLPANAGTGGMPTRQESELLAAAADVFRTAFPNPDRTGCPPRVTLASAARKGSTSDDGTVLEHLTCCSPCFSQYERLVQQHKAARNLKILALCASLAIAAAVATWFYSRPTAPTGSEPAPTIVQKQPPPAAPAPPPQYETARIDLRNRSPVRGAQAVPDAEDVVATVPGGMLNLSVVLPIGSEEDQYAISIARDDNPPIAIANAAARVRDHLVVLQTKIDLTTLTPGRYLLGVRRGRFRETYYPIAVER